METCNSNRSGGWCSWSIETWALDHSETSILYKCILWNIMGTQRIYNSNAIWQGGLELDSSAMDIDTLRFFISINVLALNRGGSVLRFSWRVKIPAKLGTIRNLIPLNITLLVAKYGITTDKQENGRGTPNQSVWSLYVYLLNSF